MKPVANVHDVAAYILQQCGELSAMKLEKLVYYCQAWSLVWDDRPLFTERIEAWKNGPVAPALYEYHKHQASVSLWPLGNTDAIIQESRETIDAVLSFYSPYNALELSNLTHRERPWREARIGLADNERSNTEITPVAMVSYYRNPDDPFYHTGRPFKLIRRDIRKEETRVSATTCGNKLPLPMDASDRATMSALLSRLQRNIPQDITPEEIKADVARANTEARKACRSCRS